MYSSLGFIAVIIILLISSYLFFCKFSRHNKLTDSERPSINLETTIQEFNHSKLPWEITVHPSNDINSYNYSEPLNMTNRLKDQIGTVINLSLHTNDLIRKEKKVIIKFSEDALAKLASGDLKIMNAKGSIDQFRALAIDHKHRIRHHGKFEIQDIKKINPSQLMNLAFGVMTMVTAQEHMNRINKQLTTLNQKVDILIRQSKNDKAGIIRGHVRYLLSILPSIYDEKQLYKTTLENIVIRSYQELESILPELEFLIMSANEIQEKTSFKLKKTVEEITEIASSFENIILLGYGNLEVISVCLKIMNDWDQDSKTNLTRLADIEMYHRKITECNQKFEKILMNKHINIDATFRRKKTIDSKKENIDNQLSYHQKKINSSKMIVNEHIDQLISRDDQLISKFIDLGVEFDEKGEINSIYRLK